MPINFSAFVEDMRLDALPKAVQQDIKRFVDAKAHHQFPHYGMVVKELLPKADPQNLKTARAHVRKLPVAPLGKIVNLATRRGDKYILVLNDRIIDGHHFLAKAERAGVTSSLNVLDLTPARFQFSMKAKPIKFEILPPERPVRTRAQMIRFARVSVAQDRYRKRIHEAEQDRAASNYAKSALAGAAIGAVTKPFGLTRTQAALGGGAAGIAAQALVRRATAKTKDSFGERSPMAKRVEKLPWQVGGAAAGVLGYRKLRGKVKFARRQRGGEIRFDLSSGISEEAATGILRKLKGAFQGPASATENVISKVKEAWQNPDVRKKLAGAAALTGGIGIADAVTSAATAKDGESSVSEGAKGLGRGLLYGGVLAGAEPAIEGILKRKWGFSALQRGMIRFDDRAQAAGWDVRDPRGRSARVFAPGSQQRQRREKYWHERVDNQRKVLGGLAVAGTLAGALAGWHARGLWKGAKVGLKNEAEAGARVVAKKARPAANVVRARATRRGNIEFPAGMLKKGKSS
jgi:hypothetical protein